MAYQTPLLKSFSELVLLMVGLAMMAGCPKPKPPAESTQEPVARGPQMQIDEVRPDSTPEGRPVTVRVIGAGFREGAEVFLGSLRARGIDVLDERELSFRATEDLKPGTYDVRITSPVGDEVIRRNGFTVVARPRNEGDCTLVTVHFDFNEASLTSGARDELDRNARCLEARAKLAVRLEGHADERGSTDYNLSLAQRRAESVRNYLVSLGVESDRLATLSYGEERPASSGHDERAWAENRRVEFSTR